MLVPRADGKRMAVMRGSPSCLAGDATPVEALENLLQVTAEVVGRELADCFAKFEMRCSGDGIDGRAGGLMREPALKPEPEPESCAMGGAMSRVEDNVDFRAETGIGEVEALSCELGMRYSVSRGKCGYTITDGSCCGYGPDADVVYCAG